MIRVRTCNRKRFTETTARSNVSTVITIVISCDRVSHVIIILPGNRGSCRHSNCGRCKSHIYDANCIGLRWALLLVPLLLEQDTNMVENNKLKLTTRAILFFII
jgi:hypothetical protein